MKENPAGQDHVPEAEAGGAAAASRSRFRLRWWHVALVVLAALIIYLALHWSDFAAGFQSGYDMVG